ncbi:MAG: hypothetical protein WC028_02700 [Candidatus Obscuribacterales bacterium]
MGSYLEINDTLQLTIEQGFPSNLLDLTKHTQNPISIHEVENTLFEFHGKKSARIFHLDPVRVFLVQNIDDKWLFWGKVYMQSQTVSKVLDQTGQWLNNEWQTSGTYKIIDLYEPEYQRAFTRREAPKGKSYF